MNRGIEEGGICIHPLGSSFMRTGQQKHSVTLLLCYNVTALHQSVVFGGKSDVMCQQLQNCDFTLDDRVKLLVILGQ